MTMWMVALLFLYFLPAALAVTAQHRQSAAIFALNFFLGWTLIGWVAALVWALVRGPNAVPDEDEAPRPGDIVDPGRAPWRRTAKSEPTSTHGARAGFSTLSAAVDAERAAKTARES